MKANTEILFSFLEKVERFANGRPVIFHGDLNNRSTILTGDKVDNTNGRNQRTAKRETALYLSGMTSIEQIARERCEAFNDRRLTENEQKSRKAIRMENRKK